MLLKKSNLHLAKTVVPAVYGSSLAGSSDFAVTPFSSRPRKFSKTIACIMNGWVG